jgi:hypothetical protein
MRKGLVIFNASFVKQNGHGVMDGNNINISEHLFNFEFWDLEGMVYL